MFNPFVDTGSPPNLLLEQIYKTRESLPPPSFCSLTPTSHLHTTWTPRLGIRPRVKLLESRVRHIYLMERSASGGLASQSLPWCNGGGRWLFEEGPPQTTMSSHGVTAKSGFNIWPLLPYSSFRDKAPPDLSLAHLFGVNLREEITSKMHQKRPTTCSTTLLAGSWFLKRIREEI